MRLSNLRALRFTIALHLGCVATAWGQWQSPAGPSTATLGAVVGSDVERYLRAMALSGMIEPIPWGARPFGPSELAAFLRESATAGHPWHARLSAALEPRAQAVTTLTASANSAFPWGANDGALWQGRGVTAAIGVGATFRIGPLSAVAAPIAFTAQNSPYPLIPVAGDSPFRDGLFPTAIDLPQRMGASAYSRLAGGESTARLQLSSLVAGVSTASLGWGTGETFPSVFGANAGGFSHAFAGTSGRGIRVPRIGRFSGRYVLGVLEQTPWSPVQGSPTYVSDTEVGTRRVGSGITVSFMPAAVPTLEIGASRFYHSPSTAGPARWSAWSKPIEELYKKSRSDASAPGDTGAEIDNQVAAVFTRWTFPRRGIEAAFEIFRDDHNWDARDLAQESENNMAVVASLRTIIGRSASGLGVLTLEYFDGDVRPIAQQRSQGALYAHSPLRQGHTQRGQLLGSPIGVGAIAGSRAAFERFTPTGSLRASLQRWRTRSLRSADPEALFRAVNYRVEGSHDWVIDASMGSSRLRRHQSYSLDAGVAWAGVWQFKDSRTNWYARFGWSAF